MTSKIKIISSVTILLFAIFIIQSCNQGSLGSATNVTETPSSSPGSSTASTNTCSTASTKIIGYGERSTAATAGLRGAFSDVTINPANNYPGFVYTDVASLSLKYMFWDGTKYNIEIIAAGLTFNFVKLVYLTDGRPLIFWANAATAIYMASRDSNSASSTSTWTVATIDNVATMTTRSVEATVSPSNQVGVFYISAAGTMARVVLCNSNCENAASYSGMGVVGNFITNTASATANSSDIKFCNAGGGVYYPYVVYPGTVNSLIGRCTQATLSNCLTPGNWTTTNITDGTNLTGANQFVAKLHIDSGSAQPFQVVARRSTGNEIRAYAQAAGECATGALTFSATQRLISSGASLGNAYGSLVRDSSSRWHLVLNDGTASIRYMNQTTGSILSAWNASSIIQTTTIGAAGATHGGLAVDENSDQVLLTYGRTAAGTPIQTLGNVVVAYSNCPSGGVGCSATTLGSSSAATDMTFGNTPLDITGMIQLATAQLTNSISVAVTSIGRPAIAFIDNSAGSATTGRLKYRYRSGPLNSDSWFSVDIGTASSPHNVSLAFDHTNRPWLAYYDANSLRYFLLTNNQTDGLGVWSQYQFPVPAATAATLPAVNNVALAMSYSNGVAKPLMIVSNSGAATRIIRSAIFDLTTETWSSNNLIDTGTNQFSRLGVDFNTSGKVTLAYHDTTNIAVRYSQSIDAGITWSAAATIITGTAGMGLDIRLNPVSGLPGISYYERASNLVRYKSCTSVFAGCISSANWQNLGTGIVESTAGISTLTAAATDGLLSTALTFSLDGYPWIIYSSGATGNANLYLSKTSSSSTFFGAPSVISAGSNANATTPVAATPANFGVGGWNSQSIRSSYTGSLFTAFVGPGNYLYMTSCGD